MISGNREWDSFNYSPRIQQFSVLSLSFNTATEGILSPRVTEESIGSVRTIKHGLKKPDYRD